MKCSSRRNCNTSQNGASADALSLNEVQFPKELQLSVIVSQVAFAEPQ